MRVVIQRVTSAKVEVDNKVVGNIGVGFLALVGIHENDDKTIVDKVAKKVSGLRVFDDEDGKMNLNLQMVNGEILSVSQFTLYGDCKKGFRPSFISAARPEKAKELYLYFNECIRVNGIKCEEGIFQAEMKVSLVNDGPITIIIDSNDL